MKYTAKRIYLAGPMTGIPAFNFPAFDAAAKDLRGKGWNVVSPAELDDPVIRREALKSKTGHEPNSRGETWGDFLARDVKLIADDGIEGIITLDGWRKSKGARLETFIGRLLGLPILKYRDMRSVTSRELEKAHGLSFDHVRSTHAKRART
jgi:hypothetical protein